MLILIDNYDSFTHNIAQYFAYLGVTPTVLSNDTTLESIIAQKPSAIIIGPGPCTPYEAGVSLAIFTEPRLTNTPMLGVCLGHQALAAAYGASIVKNLPIHGQIHAIHHDGKGIFVDLPSPFMATRYHSLAVDKATLSSKLQASAWADDGTVMALRHTTMPRFGVQFHPESVGSQGGLKIFANFLTLANINHYDATRLDALC